MPRPRPATVRFWEKVTKTDTCWLWRGAPDHGGYGRFVVSSPTGKRFYRAHRYAYLTLVGPIPDGLVLDHLCRNRACVNPAHMEPVTQAENVRRGVGVGGSLNTHCVNGHEFTPDNTAYRGKHRVCRACVYDRGVRRRQKARLRE